MFYIFKNISKISKIQEMVKKKVLKFGNFVEIFAFNSDKFKEFFKKKIRFLISKVITLTLDKCAHNFCCTCIFGVIRAHDFRCPECRKPFIESEINPPSRLMKNILAGIKLSCEFPNCQEQIGYENYR